MMTPKEFARIGEGAGVVEVEIIKVIRVVSRKGAGISISPVRLVTSYFHFNGDLIAEDDKFKSAEKPE